jgi:cysteinyl-tRNA synthetase
VIKLTELFSGNHPLLTQAFHPMTVRFFILQSHYRSPLDFGSEALAASEKALKRLWEGYEILKKLQPKNDLQTIDEELDSKILKLVNEFDEFMNDDFSTAKVLANMFEIVPTINSFKDGLIPVGTISASTLTLLQNQFKIFIEDIFGLKNVNAESNTALQGVMQLLVEMRKEAKLKKDYATSDKIRNQLATLGIEIKDEKDGSISWNIN